MTLAGLYLVLRIYAILGVGRFEWMCMWLLMFIALWFKDAGACGFRLSIYLESRRFCGPITERKGLNTSVRCCAMTHHEVHEG